MSYQHIWTKSKRLFSVLFAIILFFSGWGNYDFSVWALGDFTIELSDDSELYTGEPIYLPSYRVDIESYDFAWSDSKGNLVIEKVTDAGIYTLTVVETAPEIVMDPETGDEIEVITKTGREASAIFTILEKEITSDMVELSCDSETVTGENFRDIVTVSVRDYVNGTEVELKKGKDFDVEIPDMLEEDTYEIKVTGKGNYTGEVEKIFELTYAADGTAKLQGNTLDKNAEGKDVYADSVTAITEEGFQLSETVSGLEFVDSITYTETPDDYIVYVKNSSTGQITEYTLNAFVIDNDVPTIIANAPEEDSDWAQEKEIVVEASGADYGVYFTTVKQNFEGPIAQLPEGMTKVEGSKLIIAEDICEKTTYYLYAIDKAGHVAEAETSVNKVDVTAPELNISGNEEKVVDDIYWKNAEELSFTVSANERENFSGLKAFILETEVEDGAEINCEFAESDLNAEGTLLISKPGVYNIQVVDMAGNKSESVTIEVKEDTKAPEIELSEPTGSDKYFDADSEVYWFSESSVSIPLKIVDEDGTDETDKSPYMVQFAADADFSDCKEVEVINNEASVAVELHSGNVGKTTYYYKVTDIAGNEGSVRFVTVGYDNTQPEITEAVITQLNGDEWINLEESGETESNRTKVAFSVSATDSETGVWKIQYRSSADSEWKDAQSTMTGDTYTFVTNESYEDGSSYAWEVRVANNVTADLEKAATKAVKDGKIDTTAPSNAAYIRFISDVKGGNESFSQEGTKWSSQIFEMVTQEWNKIWGYETVEFEVYVYDETSGVKDIFMSYQESGIARKKNIELVPVNGVNAITTGNGSTVAQNFSVFEGEITYKENDALVIRNFQIDSIIDAAGNVCKDVILGNAADIDMIYIDRVEPKLISVQIDGADVTEKDSYVYQDKKELNLAIEERFFAYEETPVYPTVVLFAREAGTSEFNPVENADVSWTNEGVGTVVLPLNHEAETEYQVTMTYADPSGNSLADSKLGVKDGLFTSKIFVIDDVAPELVNYTVSGTGCYVEEASVLKNSNADDMVVEFTINENPTYYAKTDAHAYAQENLIVKLYKEGELVKTLQDDVAGSELLTKDVDGRNHTYSFTYDGEFDTQDKFYVTIEYKDIAGHAMVDNDVTVSSGKLENGMYTSETYIIDHVAPVFDIEYSAAVNVVDNGGKSNGNVPLAEHAAYYNGNIDVTLTFGEKYFNVTEDGVLEHFEIVVTKDGSEVAVPAITWTHSDDIHTAKFTIEALADHTNDGDYQFEVKYLDCAKNWVDVSAAELCDENKEDVGIYTSPVLVMDTTAPEVITCYAENPAQTLEERDYFNEETVFNIEVSDRSIRHLELKNSLMGMTAVDVDGKEIPETQLLEDIKAIDEAEVLHTMGNEEPAVWTIALNVSTEANYDIPVQFTDLAGNEAVVLFETQDETVDHGNGYTEKVTLDKQILEENIFIRFTGDVKGESAIDHKILDDAATENGNWISKIYQFISNAWLKLWGKELIEFEVYVRDEISGVQLIEMQYLDDEDQIVWCELKSGARVKLFVDEEGIASIDESGENYVVYTGSIKLDADSDMLASDFKITKVSDKATNKLTDVTFTSSLNAEILHLDHTAPKLVGIVFDEENAVNEERYFSNEATTAVLTIEERFFGKEDTPRYPSYTLIANNVITGSTTVKEDVSTTGEWEELGNNQYSLTIPLEAVANAEVEYQIVLNYTDAAGNSLINGDGIYGVENGTFTSKLFVIDQLAPELVSYSVTGTGCYVEEASVLQNSRKDDLLVEFTIDDNPTYYAVNDNHAYAQENLVVKLYKEGELVKILQDGVAGTERLTKSVTGREHTYSFSYDGKIDTQDKFYVTVEYKDVVNHNMVDEKDTVTPGTLVNGMYTSESYIIDHISPKFNIAYSDATNVVEGTRNHAADKVVADGKSPLKGYTAYYNKDIDVTLTFEEKYYNVMDDGALEHFTIVVTKNGTKIDTPEITWNHDSDVHTAEFTMKALDDHTNDGDYQFVVTYQDCATNKMTAINDSNESTKTVGEYKSPILVMDTTAPVLESVEYDTLDKFNTVNKKDYVNETTKMTFTLKEHNPTPTSDYSITSEGAGIAAWAIDGDTSTTTLEVSMRNEKGDEQTVGMYMEDWAGNKAVLGCELRSENNTTFDEGAFTDKFTVDTVVPEIKLEYISYTSKGSKKYVLRVPDRTGIETIVQSKKVLVDYFKKPVTVKVTVDEHNFDHSLFDQNVITTDAGITCIESKWSSSGDIHVKTFTFNADNQYDLSVRGTDNAKNKLKLLNTSDMSEKLDARKSKVALSVAVDNTIPAIGDSVKPVVVINPAKAQNTTKDEKTQALYNSDVTYKVEVYDPLVNDYASGIQEIQFEVTGEDGTSTSCKVKKDGTIINGTGVTVKRVEGKVSNLARGADNKYTFYVTISSKTFNTNGIVLWVGAEDVSTRKNEAKAAPIAIDITAPKVVVSYDNNDVSNEKYFYNTRTAIITVTERNFSDDCLNFIVNGENKNISFALKDKGTGNRDDAVWVAHYTFSADQDYKVSVEVQDRATNQGTVDYTGEAPQEFTIDMTKPEISVTYDNNDALNELYYKEARTATITIIEHNFSAEDVKIELTAKDDGSVINVPSSSSWTADGDYHRATINYNYDGEFTFDINFMDLATNEAEDYEMDHFIVDLTAPELEIFDIEDRSANNGVVAPGVRFSDTNYDADGTVVEMYGYQNGLVEMKGSRNIYANGVEFKLNDFEHVPEMDDMYTMYATVYDLAGNGSEAAVMFSVNRFGSVYTFDDSTRGLLEDYYTSEEMDLIVHETNVDTLEFREITLNLNGKLKTLVEGTDFNVSANGNEESWKQYTYQIAKENFAEEGLYILTIYSEDRATNVSDNNVKGKKIEFVVDKTQPSLLITGVEDGGRYKEDSRELTIDVEDNVSLGYVEVTLNGESTKYEAAEIAGMNGKITLTAGNSNQYQTLKVTVVDAAENDPVIQELTFLVTANVFVQFFMNKPLFYGSIGAIVSLGGIWWFLGRRKKSQK